MIGGTILASEIGMAETVIMTETGETVIDGETKNVIETGTSEIETGIGTGIETETARTRTRKIRTENVLKRTL